MIIINIFVYSLFILIGILCYYNYSIMFIDDVFFFVLVFLEKYSKK